LFGAFFTGDIANKLGRRKTIILIDCVVILGSLIQLIDNFWSILIGRIVVGVAVGGYNAGTTYFLIFLYACNYLHFI
jgi:MFS family permease